ncbi:hypothetical protein C5B96_05815 [Subtercola sp. Z020]|uniref:hypothetical protein n=1 Tax=Subtercola sp. Z020 TaxID=2080582 RepID=UPI000CE8877A|nr:hypothetical protein [Subtercola sp. Z020]PPF85583.1 hypothetical protein C5B96_05815 [Subtercola sp. Z020]
MSLTVRPTTSTLEVAALSPNSWRVSDHSREPRDGLTLLGFVERFGMVYEATAIGAPLTRSYFGSLDDAVQALTLGPPA